MKSQPVITRMLPESAHGLTLDEWCTRFERPFIGTDVRITERKVAIVTRDRKLARRKHLPESEEYCEYSMSRVPASPETSIWQGTSLGIEVSLLWEQGQSPESVAQRVLKRTFHVRGVA